MNKIKKVAFLILISSACYGNLPSLSTFTPNVSESVREYRIIETSENKIATGKLYLKTMIADSRVFFTDELIFKDLVQDYRLVYESGVTSSPVEFSITTKEGRAKGTTETKITEGTAIASFEGKSMEFPYPDDTLYELALFRLVESIPETNWGPYRIGHFNPIGSITVRASSEEEPYLIFSQDRAKRLNLSGVEVPYREATFFWKPDNSHTIKFHFWISEEKILEYALMQKFDSENNLQWSRVYELVTTSR